MWPHIPEMFLFLPVLLPGNGRPQTWVQRLKTAAGKRRGSTGLTQTVNRPLSRSLLSLHLMRSPFRDESRKQNLI